MKAHGIHGNLVNWIGSAIVVSGIPQGSLLSPILFVIYINDLPDNLRGHVEMFADDTKVYAHIKDPQYGVILQYDLNSLSDWAEKWQLKFNVSKCGVMHYGSQDAPNTYDMRDGTSRTNLEVREKRKIWVSYLTPP